MTVERGNFIGHFVPASFFFGFGCFFLILTLKRCLELQSKASKNSECLSFADVHVPEHPTVLLRSGVILVTCTTAGAILEAGGGVKDGLGFFYELAHEVMYLSVFFTGMVCCLEARARLFANSHKCALSFTFLMQYLLWYEHALMLMEEDPLACRVHTIQAQINLLGFVVFGYSAYEPRSMFAYGECICRIFQCALLIYVQLANTNIISLPFVSVASWAVMVWNAAWMLTAGLISSGVAITRRNLAAILVLEALLIVIVIVVCAACFLDQTPHHRGDKREVVRTNATQLTTRSSNENGSEPEITSIC